MTNDPYSLLSLQGLSNSAKLSRSKVGDPIVGTPAFVGRIAASVTPSPTRSRYYPVHPIAVLGGETEGGPADLVEDVATTILVNVLGANPPHVGDDLICRFTDHRWVAEVPRTARIPTGPIGGSIPGCLCTQIPTVLTMTPGSYCGNVFQACTLKWGTTPPELAELPLGTDSFLSEESFYHDLFQSYYRWHLFCNTALFGVKRAFLPTTQGGPFLDATFFAWTIGLPGNHCTPFLLSNGRIFPGGDPRCTLVISE